MKIKAIIFDIGGTLVDYKKPLSWGRLFQDGLINATNALSLNWNQVQYDKAIKILTKYNTRVNPRIIEYSDKIIFNEIFDYVKEDKKYLNSFIMYFFAFFQNEAVVFEEVKSVLLEIKKKNILIGALTDVAYGMNNELAFLDIKEIENEFDLKLTSTDIGFRKPSCKGLEVFIEKWQLEPNESIYVGDEIKDIEAANAIGMHSFLINRNGDKKCYNQEVTIISLKEILHYIDY